MKPLRTILATALGVAIGLVVAGFLGNDPTEPPGPNASGDAVQAAPPPDPSVSAQLGAARTQELAAIRNELAFERDARFALAEELDLIWDELTKLASAGSRIVRPGASNEANASNSPRT